MEHSAGSLYPNDNAEKRDRERGFDDTGNPVLDNYATVDPATANDGRYLEIPHDHPRYIINATYSGKSMRVGHIGSYRDTEMNETHQVYVGDVSDDPSKVIQRYFAIPKEVLDTARISKENGKQESVRVNRRNDGYIPTLDELKLAAMSSESAEVTDWANKGDLFALFELQSRGIGASKQGATDLRKMFYDVKLATEKNPVATTGHVFDLAQFAKQIDEISEHYETHPDEPLALQYVTSKEGLRVLAEQIMTDPTYAPFVGRFEELVVMFNEQLKLDEKNTKRRRTGKGVLGLLRSGK